MNRKGKVIVHLVGGLGNQLYGYFAGVWLAQKLKLELALDLSEISIDHQNSTIESFDLKCDTFRNPLRIFIRRTFFARLIDSAFYRIRFVRKIASTFRCTYRDTSNGLFDFSDSQLVKNFGKGVHLRGFFSDSRYYKEVSQNASKEISLKLKSPSQVFLDLLTQVKVVNPIVLHLRRGDYDSMRSSLGVLSSNYYRNGLKYLLQLVDTRTVWVFSNDPNAAKSFIKLLSQEKEFQNVNFRHIKELEKSSAAENLILMSYGTGKILANSTFSIWSAILGGGGHRRGLVVCPEDYFRIYDPSQKLSLDLRPSDWHRIESSWLDEGREYE